MHFSLVLHHQVNSKLSTQKITDIYNLSLYLKSLTSSFFHLPSSIIHLPSSIIHHPSSIIPLPSSLFHLPSSIIHHPSSFFHLPSSIIHHPSSSATSAWAQDIDGKAIPRNDPATTGEHVLLYPHRNRIPPLLFPHDNGYSTQSKTGTKHHLFGSCSGNQVSEVRASRI